jgi:hypothetical protein
MYKRVPNYKLDDLIRNLESFSNYNASIVAHRQSATAIEPRNLYIITHWNTVIAEINLDNTSIDFLSYRFISQTTSTLVGRILRSLPRESVETYLDTFGNTPDRKRLARMARI